MVSLYVCFIASDGIRPSDAGAGHTSVGSYRPSFGRRVLLRHCEEFLPLPFLLRDRLLQTRKGAPAVQPTRLILQQPRVAILLLRGLHHFGELCGLLIEVLLASLATEVHIGAIVRSLHGLAVFSELLI